uniref:Uncharacterized protein n=1 Tax=Cacopsylla melanoneura TaxID=428564 RepID=A0A8D9E878_9HEMI
MYRVILKCSYLGPSRLMGSSYIRYLLFHSVLFDLKRQEDTISPLSPYLSMLVVFRSPQLNERPPPNRVFSGGHTRCFQPLRQDLTSRKHDTLIGAQFGSLHRDLQEFPLGG